MTSGLQARPAGWLPAWSSTRPGSRTRPIAAASRPDRSRRRASAPPATSSRWRSTTTDSNAALFARGTADGLDPATREEIADDLPVVVKPGKRDGPAAWGASAPVNGWSAVVRAKAAERLEPRVDVVVGVVVLALVEPQAADDAQARAVRAAERGDRLGQQDRLADRASRDRARGDRSGGATSGSSSSRQRARRSRGRGRQVFLLDPDVDRDDDLAQAAAALEGERGRRGSASARMPRFVRSETDRGRRSARRAGGPRRGRSGRRRRVRSRSAPAVVGEEAGDVPGERAVARAAPRSPARWRDGSAASSVARSPPPSRRAVVVLRRRVDGAASRRAGRSLLDALERLDDVVLEARPGR